MVKKRGCAELWEESCLSSPGGNFLAKSLWNCSRGMKGACRSGICCPEKWLPLEPWKCPRPVWTGLGAPRASGRCPCPRSELTPPWSCVQAPPARPRCSPVPAPGAASRCPHSILRSPSPPAAPSSWRRTPRVCGGDPQPPCRGLWTRPQLPPGPSSSSFSSCSSRGPRRSAPPPAARQDSAWPCGDQRGESGTGTGIGIGISSGTEIGLRAQRVPTGPALPRGDRHSAAPPRRRTPARAWVPGREGAVLGFRGWGVAE